MAPTMEKEILQQEEQLAEAKRALDLGAIDRMYADDLLLTVEREEEGARRCIHHAVCIADPAVAEDAALRRPPPRDGVTSVEGRCDRG